MRILLALLVLTIARPARAAPASGLDRAREAYALRIYSMWRENLRSAASELLAETDGSTPAATRLALADELTTAGEYWHALAIVGRVLETDLEPALIVEKDRVRGRLTTRLGRFPEGGGHLRRALERATQVYGADAVETARVRCGLSDWLRRVGQLRDAYHEAERAAGVLTGRVELADEVEALLMLGLACHEIGVLRKADELYRRALSRVAKERAEGTLLHARVLRELARLGLDRTWIDDAARPALDWCFTAQRILVEILGSRHVESAECQAIRVSLFLAASPTSRPVFQQAVDELREVVRVYESTVGADHPDCLQTRLRLMIFVPDAERWTPGEVVSRTFDAIYEVMGLAQHILDPPNPSLGWVYCLVGDFYHFARNKKLMEKYWLKAVRQFEALQIPASFGGRLAGTRYGGALMHRKRRKKALPHLIDVYQGVRLAEGDDHPSTILARMRFHILLEERLHVANAGELLDRLPDPSSAVRDGIDFQRMALVFETPLVFSQLAASSAGVTESVTPSTNTTR